MTGCKELGCASPHRARGLCGAHYQQARRAGEFESVPHYADDHDRLQRNTQANDRGCWEWTGKRTPEGYGVAKVSNRSVFAHRLSYEAHVGPIPAGLVIDHLCRNTSCVRPAHLEAVTDRVNVLRSTAPAAENARKTHCKRNHEFTPENTRRAGRNGKGRRCRTCESAYDRRRRSEGVAA